MTDPTAPERIWLQTDGDYAAAKEAAMGTDTGVTWCDASVNDDDTEYIRADLVAAMLAEARAQEREACAAIADARDTGDMTREDMEARRIAAAIRARGDET